MWQNRDLSKIVTNVSWWVCFRHRCDQAMFVMTWIFTLFNEFCESLKDVCRKIVVVYRDFSL